MCGIAGIIHHHGIDLSMVVKALHHRGPDDQHIMVDNEIALMHTRLAIQDVRLGIQPFHHENYTIVFNGEIYNHQILRRQLTEFQFKTNSDTETLLYLYIKYQTEMFSMLDGMFAFCIYDSKNKKMLLARDRAGKKPLYYALYDNRFIFASELNAIKAIQPLTIDDDAIQCYLRVGFIPRSYTPYRQVHELESASYFVINTETLRHETRQYFHFLSYYESSFYPALSFNESLMELEKRLSSSIADRITASDVEVGVFLSGGIDSNLIAAIAANFKKKIKTFTVKFSGQYDESMLAAITAKQYNTDHTELQLTNPDADAIESILHSYGEPFMDSSAIPSYCISKKAADYVKVILSGDGADELFAGYRRYVSVQHQLPKYSRWISPLRYCFPSSKIKQSRYYYFTRLLAMANKNGLDFYLSATTDVFEDVIPIAGNKIIDTLHDSIMTVMSNNQLSPLKRMLFLDFHHLLFGDLLVKMDIASMANSLEVRSPFLSKYLLEFAPLLPDHFKINGLKTKYILRKLAEKYLSIRLTKQPKRGFEVPLQRWVDHELHDAIHDRLTAGCYASHFIDYAVIQRLLANDLALSAEKRAKIIWSLYCLEVWYQHGIVNRFHR